ncbi:MAG: SDR family oxidoreductase [Verrucomicrobia bacterium]|nr:SDR family oxidoreductase [Verrucomicrobiota bacterium]
MSRHTVIITGATKGLGRETALAFARAGHRVLGLYANDDAAAEKLRVDLRPLSDDSEVIRHDVTRENVELWSRPEIERAESLVLINNACAPFAPQPFHLLRWEDFESGLAVGLKGSWLCARAVLRPMARAGRGTIVNVLTTALHGLPPKGFAAYATAKHAVRGLTLALAAEYAARGVRVFSVSPGFMSTALTAGWDARLVEAIRAGAPETMPADAARRILELVTDAATPGQGEDHRI